jgi:hypothetical protein
MQIYQLKIHVILGLFLAITRGDASMPYTPTYFLKQKAGSERSARKMGKPYTKLSDGIN